jgi:hypothetical protein
MLLNRHVDGDALVANVEITKLELSGVAAPEIAAFHIDEPRSGGSSAVYAFDLRGWALGTDQRVAAVQVVHEGRVIRTARLEIARADVMAVHPAAKDANCGFWTQVSTVGLPPEFELSIEATFEAGCRVVLARIGGCHKPLLSGYEPRYAPILVTSLGRTGTTWLMHILFSHPKIGGFRRYPYEVCPAKYWLHMLRVLAAPANHLESAHWEDFAASPWWVGHHPFHTAPLTDNSRIREWFSRSYPERLSAFCQQSIDGLYSAIAEAQQQTEMAYFAEKVFPDATPWLFWELYPRAKEIVLVRDLRDTFCSIRSMNRQRGSYGFGWQCGQDDFSYIDKLGVDAVHLLRSWRARRQRAYLLRYEDLMSQPAATLSPLLRYLEVDASADTVISILESAFEDTRELQQHRTTRSPAQSIGRWRRDLSRDLRKACERVFGEVLEEFGYLSAREANEREAQYANR